MSFVCKTQGYLEINCWPRHPDIWWFLKSQIFFMWVGLSNINTTFFGCRRLKLSGNVTLDLLKTFVSFLGQKSTYFDFLGKEQKCARLVCEF